MDLDGGAAIATYRLHSALRKHSVDSTLLVQRKRSDDPTVVGPSMFARSMVRPRRFVDRLPLRFYPKRNASLFSPTLLGSRVTNTISELDPDLVHLFWITGGFMRPESLSKIKKPLIWTMHDMWPFTGGCHYDAECGRYHSQCGACPELGSARENDLSRGLWARKANAWKSVELTIVSTSRWLADCARASSLFSRYRIEVIPNCIDVDTYRPLAKDEARRRSGLPSDKKLILLSAFSATTDARKGYHLLVAAIRKISLGGWGPQIEVVVLGASKPTQPDDLGVKVTYVPYLHDEESQVLLYSACDVLVAPSLQENLSNTVLESLACGTPVVAFDIGGMPDMIRHQFNGYLAKPFDVDDLALGVTWVLEDAQRHDQLSRAAHVDAAARFNFGTVAAQYERLYREILR